MVDRLRRARFRGDEYRCPAGLLHSLPRSSQLDLFDALVRDEERNLLALESITFSHADGLPIRAGCDT